MEDVPDLYKEEYNPRYPTVCFDEKLVAPEADVHLPEPMAPGQPERVDEARRILQRVEFHYTPKHGSWLNMAEIEISIFARSCLSRHMESMQ
jgi:DDE superfamily endonuclease